MSDIAAARAPKKRGPKPIGDRPMTPGERKKRSRLRQAHEGYAEFTVRASGDTLNFIDLYATSNGIARTEVIAAFLDLAINRIGHAMGRALERMKQGDAPEVAMSLVHDELAFKPDGDVTEKLMEVLRTN
jgi:hypothetical protein